MITKDDMLPVLLDACPSFAPAWQEFLAEWQGEADLPLYVALSYLAWHLIGLVERGEGGELPAVFRVVERWHLEGDEYVHTAATEGLLEDLQNWNLHEHGTEPAQFRAMLGPESLRCWDRAAASWDEFFRAQAAEQRLAGPLSQLTDTKDDDAPSTDSSSA
ncbi:MAG: hypothetical protein K1X57_08110 [Gemmataceae bacterium]|nr:hypothetical protein [Gemmataceae bacterium]